MNNSRVSGRGESLRCRQFSPRFFYFSVRFGSHGFACRPLICVCFFYSFASCLVLFVCHSVLWCHVFFHMFSLFLLPLICCLACYCSDPLPYCPTRVSVLVADIAQTERNGVISQSLGHWARRSVQRQLRSITQISHGCRALATHRRPVSRSVGALIRPTCFLHNIRADHSMEPLKPNQVAQFHKTVQNQTTRLSNKGKQPAQSLHYLLSLSHCRHFTDATSAMIKF